MVVKVEELTSITEFREVSKVVLERKLKAVESLIRSHTNNNFQNRSVRFEAGSLDDRILGTSPFLKVGDTVQISQSQVNDGLYAITELLGGAIRVDKGLFTTSHNLVTKVEYPSDVQEGVVNLLLWEVENRKKIGIKSETISRHSVAYYDLDANNQVMGYPVSLLGFLQPYLRARF